MAKRRNKDDYVGEFVFAGSQQILFARAENLSVHEVTVKEFDLVYL